MKTKSCGKCKYFDNGWCDNLDCAVIVYMDCHRFEPKVITNGDKIWQGGNRALAEFHGKLACDVCAYRYDHRCIAQQGRPLTCVDGIEAWLNAPAESEGKDE